MDGDQLKQALEHDQAAKTAVPQEILQAPVSLEALGKQLDDKLAVMSKTVALGFLSVARDCQALGMSPSEQKVVKGSDGQPQIEGKPPRPDVAEKWMTVAAAAVDLARRADVLGDRPLVRQSPAKE